MPTGSGKTVVAHAIADGALGLGKRVLIVAHTRQIVEQTARRFECPMVMAEHRGEGPLLVASIQTLASRGAPPFDVLIVDECHHAAARTYREIIEDAPVVVGLTATPQRLDGKGLGDVGFGCIIEPVTTAELIRDGFLAEPLCYARPFDDSRLKKERGEFTADSAEASVTELSGEIAEHWVRHGKGRLGVAFSCSIAHAEGMAHALRRVGAQVEAVSGEDGTDRRTDVLTRLKNREIDLVVNCQLYGEGWDLPELDLCIMARPTASLTVYRQQVGRIMRAKAERPILLDHAGNLARHGFVTEIIEWSLDGRPKKDKRPAPFKTCPECQLCVPLAVKVCPNCGHVFHDVREIIEVAEAELGVVERPEDREAMYVHFLQRAWQQAYRIGWARYKYKTQYGSWPRLSELERKHYPCTDHVYETKVSESGFRRVCCQWCGRAPTGVSDSATDPVRDRLAP